MVYIIKRILLIIPTVFCISVLTFLLIHIIPGDPVLAILGEKATPENYQRLRKQLNLDKPLYEQYLMFMDGIFLKQEVKSYTPGGHNVIEEVKKKYPATIELSIVAILIAVFFGLTFGILAAIKKNSIFDWLLMTFSVFGVSIPIFFLGLLLLIIFSGILPSFGRLSLRYVDFESVTGLYALDSLLRLDFEVFIDVLKHMILPAFTLATVPMAVISRMTRTSMIEVLESDYIKTAKAKGLPMKKIVLKHALKNALIPIFTVIGVQFGYLLTGAVLTETIYSWDGIGKFLYQATMQRDIPTIQVCVIVISFSFAFVNLLVDVSYSFIDPRIKTGK